MQFLYNYQLKIKLWIWISLIFSLYSYSSIVSAIPLSLTEAERIAISNSPELKRYQATAMAFDQQAVADGQLPDPQLTAGAINVPTNTFSFTQDDMTMIQVGLQQAFLPGQSLAAKSKQTKALGKAEQRKLQQQITILLRNVRETWLDLYYYQWIAQVIRENRSLYRRLLKSSESQYSAGQGTQSSVLQVQLELTRLNDQYTQTQQQLDVFRAEWERWIGQGTSNRPLSHTLPKWPRPPAFSVLQERLKKHPLLKVDTANVEAAYHEVEFAREQYKPGWMVGVGYGIRQGRMSDGRPRSNMLTAEVTVDLPIFPSNRQDKRLCTSAHRFEAAKFDRDTHYRDLLKELRTQYVIWQRLSERESLYNRQLIPEARQNSKAALMAYQSATIDLNTVLRAYSNELNIKLEKLQIKVEKAKARAALLYLEGVTAC